MEILSASFIAIGAIGMFTCLCAAWSWRDNKKLMKGLIIAGIICALMLAIGIALISPELSYSGSSSSSSGHRCAICGKSYSSGGTSNMCSQCYKNYKYAYGS